jgi:GDPmannose 4,6-dehydratase
VGTEFLSDYGRYEHTVPEFDRWARGVAGRAAFFPDGIMKTALIIGITGQDGSYLAESLCARDYAVHGLVRRASMFNRARIDPLRHSEAAGQGRLTLHYGELNDLTSFRRLLRTIEPDEVYHLAGQSHVGLSFEIPEVTCQENGMGTLHLIEALRDLDQPARFYHAASSEIFGSPTDGRRQTEDTPVAPVNPYGCAKAFATQLCRVYRRAHGLFLCSGIAYNHESPRRGENFVTRKISMAAARIRAGQQAVLRLGNLDARRDWGYAQEYVEAMWLTLQADKPDDYILATGRTVSVREFAAAAFTEAGMEVVFEGSGENEIGRRRDTGATVIAVDSRYYRPVDSTALVGDPTRAKQVLGWAAKTEGEAVARLMVRAEGALLTGRPA